MIAATDPTGAAACPCCLPRRGFIRGLAGFGAVAAAITMDTARAEPAPQGPRYTGVVIDCHGHYTTEPPAMLSWRKRQIDAINDPAQSPSPSSLRVSDDEIRESVSGRQLKLQSERGISLALFSPRAGGMGHHIGTARTSLDWSIVSNDMIHRVASLMPKNFVGVCQLPQTPGLSPKNCTAELERCVKDLGFVGCNVNPDPSGGYWTDPPLSDRFWYPLWEKMVELDVPGMVHVSASANPNFHATGAHYINGDTSAFMQFVTSDLFKDFPTLRLIIPHGGGAVPYHWGRYRGLAQDLKRPPLSELMRNVYFDTCVYHQPGIDLLLKVVPHENVLFASEMVGAVNGTDPETGHAYDDTKRYVDAAEVSDTDRVKIYAGNTLKVYPRLASKLKSADLMP
jgi:4-oxalmesaconate hydratase